MFSRFVPQSTSGYLFHRWTTNSNSSVIDSYNNATTSLTSSFTFYSANPYYGIGCFYNYLKPIYNSDEEQPYIDFFVYGELSGGGSAHYLNLTSNTINQQTNTRFYLDKNSLSSLFDGSFHSVKCIWNTSDYYKNGRIYIDNNEIKQSIINGDGRTQSLNYSLSTNTNNILTTPLYFLSKCDSSQNTKIQTSSKFSCYNETKHILVFDDAISGNAITNSVTSNDQLFLNLGSLTGNLRTWFGFNSLATSSVSALDLTLQYSSNASALTGTIVNDSANAEPEGQVANILSLLHDKQNNFAPSVWDNSLTSEVHNQKPIGRIFNNEYGLSNSESIGYIFYDKGEIILLNDCYNKDYNLSTQLFVSSTSTTFSFTDSTSSWKVYYLSFGKTKYYNRKIVGLTADAEHFCKSLNRSSLFTGNDGKTYSKSNQKVITGIIWYDRDGVPVATTKFSQPIIKKENNSVGINVKVDL